MDIALFLVAFLGIMFMPDFPDFEDNASASGNGELPDEEGSNNNATDLLDDNRTSLAMSEEAEDLDESDLSQTDETDAQPLEVGPADQPAAHLVEKDDTGEIAFAEVAGFESGEDVLAISMDTDAVEGDLDVDVVNSLSGEDSLVFVEAELIAVLRGTPDVDAEDVLVKIVTMAS